jgi:hypothetical protein
MPFTTQLAANSSPVQLSPRHTGRRRLVVVACVTFGFAAAATMGNALGSQRQPAAVDPSTERAAPVPERSAVQRPSPWRDTWYLEEEFSRRAVAAASGPSDLSVPTHDDWALTPDRVRPLDLSPRTHDDWPLK